MEHGKNTDKTERAQTDETGSQAQPLRWLECLIRVPSVAKVLSLRVLMSQKPRVVIVGGGFGGLYAARSLRKAPVDITLVDRRNFHLFQPLLYQVATGGLSPANIAAPLRAVLRQQRNVRVWLGEVTQLDLNARQVILADGTLPYDMLIVSAGARHHYFGHPEWEKFAPGLKSIEDATEMRRRLLLAFEKAERCTDPVQQQEWLTFVVVGGGPTGVELAGTIGELAHHTLRGNFRSIQPSKARILLVEGLDRVLSTFPPKLSAKAARALTQLGVTVRTGAQVIDIQADQVTLRSGADTEVVRTHTIFWGAGVAASPLARMLADATGAALDRAGRVTVQPDLSLPGHPEVFAIGDMANYPHQTGKPLPGVAPVAMQQGAHVADLIQRRLRGAESIPFVYRDRGNLATIGRAAAVADLGWLRLSGFSAWLIWLFVHILFLIEFQNRLLVLTQWAWNYFTRNRSARLITGEHTEQQLQR
jgi:NADH dehydrogenase